MCAGDRDISQRTEAVTEDKGFRREVHTYTTKNACLFV